MRINSRPVEVGRLRDECPHRQDFQGIPRVLESGGSIVGRISSVWAKYVLGDRELCVAVAAGAAVDPPDDDPDLVTCLLRAAAQCTRAASFDILEWNGLSVAERTIAERSSMVKCKLDVWQAFYYTRDPLARDLATPER